MQIFSHLPTFPASPLLSFIICLLTSFLFLNADTSKLNILIFTGRPLGDEESFVSQVHDQRHIGLALFMGRRIDAGMAAYGIGFVKMIY